MRKCPNPDCAAQNPPNARFCQACGSTLAATTTGKRTVVAPPPLFPVQHAHEQVEEVTPPPYVPDTGPQPVRPGPVAYQGNGQREHQVLVIDHSGSMGQAFDGRLNKLDAVKRAVLALILEKERIDPQDEIGLVVFNGRAQLVQPLCPVGSHKRELIQAAQSIQVAGGTDINAGLKVARNAFNWSQSDVVRRIVLQTDGHGGHPLGTAEDLKGRGVVIDVIGTGPEPSAVDEKLLREVASVIGGETHYWFLKDQESLRITLTGLGDKTQLR